MNAAARVRRSVRTFLTAIQFLTRVPAPSLDYQPDSLSRAVGLFPLVGALIGGAAALLHHLFVPHLNRQCAALLVLVFLVSITGCFHEDGLADTADGFGGGWNREQVMLILRDSRIGSYGAAALTLCLIARLALISSLPLLQITQYLVAAHVLCRWTTLPLSYFLPPAREADGQGARLAQFTSRSALVLGTLFSFTVVAYFLRARAVAPILASILITAMSGRFYMRKIGGVTGDCFGATNQIAEVAVYLCGAWIA
jgi:adenosylcobinamide-GDP ribazoletransferase